jgi:paired amphipathic helix protein Sin3a
MEEFRHEEQRERHRQDPQIHQPIALPPHAQGVHGPNGLLGNQGHTNFPAAPHLQPSLPPQGGPVSQLFAAMPPGHPFAPNGAGGPAGNAQQPILNDALSYLDQVKGQFSDQPDVYNRFLDIMKEFKGGSIDTPGVIERVSQLFVGNPQLIQGFNTFLPPGYRIDCGFDDDPNSIRVTTPMGTTLSNLNPRPSSPRQTTMQHFHPVQPQPWQSPHPPHEHGHQQIIYTHQPGLGPPVEIHRDQMIMVQEQQRHTPNLPPANSLFRGPALLDVSDSSAQGDKRAPVEFNHAISYVNKIKNRFASQPDIYKQFLEILQTYQRDAKPIGEVYAQVTRLFETAPDLLQDFKQFLPDTSAFTASGRRAHEEQQYAISSMRSDPAYMSAAQAAQLTPRIDQQRLPPMGNFAPTPSSGRDKRKRDRQNFNNAQFGAEPAAGRPAYNQQASKVSPSSHVLLH